MKIERQEVYATDETIFVVIFKGHELITSSPSDAEIIAKKLYEKTKTVSDGLMYLSEVAHRIETARENNK